jgi:uncharacterized membrane protein (UPF0127 family)
MRRRQEVGQNPRSGIGLCMTGKRRGVYVFNKTKETFLAFTVTVADSVIGRLVGLLGKRALEPGGGVWVVPCNSIHTIGMLFKIDVVLVDRDLKVVGLHELVRPFSVTSPNFHAESVIELPVHTIFNSRTEIGDQLVIERYEKRPIPEPARRGEPQTV